MYNFSSFIFKTSCQVATASKLLEMQRLHFQEFTLKKWMCRRLVSKIQIVDCNSI